MSGKKRKAAVRIVLSLMMIAVGTNIFAYSALASDQDRAANTSGDQASADLPPLHHVIDDVTRLPSEAGRWHAYVTKPLWPGELGYRQIPWLVDLNEGLRVAREEKRPVLLWTSGDDPLDRC